MGDLVVRIESEERADVHAVVAELRAQLVGIEGVTDVDVAADDSDEERIDPMTLVAIIGGITLVLKATNLSLVEAEKLLEHLQQILITINGIKKATLELTGKASVPIAEAKAEEVVVEAGLL